MVIKTIEVRVRIWDGANEMVEAKTTIPGDLASAHRYGPITATMEKARATVVRALADDPKPTPSDEGTAQSL